ncbi:hypothetical protein MPER_02433, partial [Moniliophthora perniciosa FA553]
QETGKVEKNFLRSGKIVDYSCSIYTSFTHLHIITTRLYVCDHLSELVSAAEEAVNDVKVWTPGDTVVLISGGYTVATSAETAFDTDGFTEAEYIEHVKATSGNLPLVFNWQVNLLPDVYETRDKHPKHIRQGLVNGQDRDRYMKQVKLNQEFIKKWVSSSPVNTSTWVALV